MNKIIKNLIRTVEMGITALEKYQELQMSSSTNIISNLEKSKQTLLALKGETLESIFKLGNNNIHKHRVNTMAYLSQVLGVIETGNVIKDGKMATEEIKENALKCLLSYGQYVIHSTNEIMENLTDDFIRENDLSPLRESIEELNDLMEEVLEDSPYQMVDYYGEKGIIIDDTDDTDIVPKPDTSTYEEFIEFITAISMNSKEEIDRVIRNAYTRTTELTIKDLKKLIKIEDGDGEDNEKLSWDTSDSLSLEAFKEDK